MNPEFNMNTCTAVYKRFVCRQILIIRKDGINSSNKCDKQITINKPLNTIKNPNRNPIEITP